MSLSPRQQSILNRVVDSHIETAQPVGSRFITELYTEIYHDSYSPATVRHEMGLLEDMGYLTHPHPSAGRVPTDQGYRYYVEHGLRPEIFAEDFTRELTRELLPAREEAEPFADQASRLLSRWTGEAGLVFLPERQPGFFLQGTSRILEKPEFRDVEKLRMILQIFEEKSALADWLGKRIRREGVVVTIGRENEPEAFRDCAVLSVCYSGRGKTRGMLAVIGPRRMRYSRAVPFLSQMGRILEGLLGSLDPE